MPSVTFEIFQRKLELLASTDQIVKKGDAHLKKSQGVPVASTAAEATSDSSNPPSLLSESPPLVPISYPSTCHSLFDNRVSQTIDQNISYMARTFSFFIPDEIYLKDKEGLIEYLGAKLYSDGHFCLFCDRPFKSLFAVRSHMISKGHTTIGIDAEEQQEELEPFYDYSESYKELNFAQLKKAAVAALTMGEDATGEEEDDWSDASREEEEEELADLMGRHGLESARINDYGNLVVPGRGEAAHRSVAYVYSQRLPLKKRADPCIRLALMHAKQLRALTEHGESTGPRGESRQLARQERQWRSRSQMFDLKVGMKNNKLNRTMKTAEKYFI